MKKAILMALSLVLVAAIAVGGTLAYLTYSDEDVNTMTVGNVKIEQLEYERVVDENGNWITTEYTGSGYTADLMQEYTQGKPLYPAVYADGTTKWDDRNGSQAPSGEGSHQQPWSQIGAPGSNQLFDDSMKNVQDKFVFVKNTGKSDAYYRTFIAIECPVGLDSSLIRTNTTGNTRFSWQKPGYITIDGVQYYLMVATYNEILTPGEISRPSLLQVFLDPAATNEDVALFDGSMEILVVSQAVQAAGFDTADAALTEAFGDVSDGYNPWGDSYKLPTIVSSAAELKAAIEAASAGETVSVILADDITVTETITAVPGANVVIDGGNHTLTADVAAKTSAIFVQGGLEVQNLNIVGNEGAYGIRSQGGTSTLTNVDVEINGNYALCFYGGGVTELNNCTVSGTASVSSVWFGDGRTVTINGGTYSSVLINCSKGSNQISAGSLTVNSANIDTVLVGAVKQDDGTVIRANLVSNDSTIGEVVYEY